MNINENEYIGTIEQGEITPKDDSYIAMPVPDFSHLPKMEREFEEAGWKEPRMIKKNDLQVWITPFEKRVKAIIDARKKNRPAD